MAIDIDLDDNHDVYIIDRDLAITPPDDQTKQELSIRLQLWRGEWFLDVLSGIPYLQEVLKKRVSIDTVASIFKTEILAADGVIEILEFEMSFDSDRALRIDFKVSAEDGIIFDTLEITV